MKLNQSVFTLVFGLAALFQVSARPVLAATPTDEDYYKQFLYTETTDADGNVSTRFLMAEGFDVGQSPQGHVVGSMGLFLISDGSFVIHWTETTDQGFPIAFGLNFKGTWAVPGELLLVGDIATGTRSVYEGRNAVQLTFLKDLNTPGLTGKTAILDYGFSNEKPTDCPFGCSSPLSR